MKVYFKLLLRGLHLKILRKLLETYHTRELTIEIVNNCIKILDSRIFFDKIHTFLWNYLITT